MFVLDVKYFEALLCAINICRFTVQLWNAFRLEFLIMWFYRPVSVVSIETGLCP